MAADVLVYLGRRFGQRSAERLRDLVSLLTLCALTVSCVALYYLMYVQKPPVVHITTSRAVLTYATSPDPRSAAKSTLRADEPLARVTPGLPVTYARSLDVRRPATGTRVTGWFCDGTIYDRLAVPVAYTARGVFEEVFTIEVPLAAPAGRCAFAVSLVFPRGLFDAHQVDLPPVPVEVARSAGGAARAPAE